jgi:uncharacterized delta-60 repeat protein
MWRDPLLAFPRAAGSVACHDTSAAICADSAVASAGTACALMADMNRSCSWSLASLLAVLTGCGDIVETEDDVDNEAPVAMSAELSTYMSTPIVGQLEADDADGDPLTYQVAGDPASGTLELADDGSFRYLPDRGVSGADSFSFVVTDGPNTSDEATIDISIATLTDGTPDESFGDGGAVITDFGDVDAFSGVAVLDGGRVAAVGNTASTALVVAGYSDAGELIAGWGEGGSGSTIVNLAGYDGLGDLVQQASGRLVSVGQSQGGDRDFMLLGLDADGMLDSSFGGGGLTLTDVGGGNADVANAVALLPDGRLLVAGYANNGTDDDFAVARYSVDGALDDSFGSGGTTVLDFGATDRVNNLAVDGEGNIVLVGEAGTDMGIARLLADGDPDTSFGEEGMLTVDRGGEYDEAIGVAFGPDGSIYVGGNTQVGTSWSMAAVKLTPSGDLDTDFGEGGWALAGSTAANLYSADMLLLPNQTLLLVGSWGEGEVSEAGAARFDLSGALDPEFGDAGIYHQAIGSAGQDTLFAADLQDDGKVVAAGWSRNADLDAVVLRFGW